MKIYTTTHYGPAGASMQEAIEQNDGMAVHAMALRGADVNARMENGLSPLQYAAQLGAADCVRMLLYEGAYANISYTGLKPLGRAAVQGHAACVELLLAGGAELAPISTGNALVMAARAGHAECVRLLLEYGTEDSYLYSALKAAVEQGHTACAEMLATECAMMVDADEDLAVVVRESLKATELRDFALQPEVLAMLAAPHRPATVMQALCLNDMEAMRRLLAEGASLCMCRMERMVPSSLYYAVEYADSAEAARLLLCAGANARDMGVYDAYEVECLLGPMLREPGRPVSVLGAVRARDAQALAAMLASGASPDKPRTAAMRTPLMCALMNRDSACVKLLLHHGAEVFVRDAEGHSPLDLAADHHVQMVRNVIHSRYRQAGIALQAPAKKVMNRKRFFELLPEQRGVTLEQKLGYLVRLLQTGEIASEEPVVLQLFELGLDKEELYECAELFVCLEKCGLQPDGDTAKKLYELCVQYEQEEWAEHLLERGLVP